MRAKNLGDLYKLPLVEWSEVVGRLSAGIEQAPGTGGPNHHVFWLATVNADGSPHQTGVGCLWAENALWFETGRATRKGRNLARDPRCSLCVNTDEFHIIIEGNAELITDPDTVAKVARWYAEDGWPATVDASGTALTADYSAPSAGAPPWHVYRVVPQAATVLSVTGAGGATRFDF